LLLHGSLFAVVIGQQTDLFHTDLGATEPLERAARHTIGPGTSYEHRRLLQGHTDRSSLQLGEQPVGWTPAPLTVLAPKTSSLDLHTPKDGCYHPAHGSLQSSLLVATLWARRVLLFPVSDGLFQSLSHGLLTGLLNLLFHLGEASGCR